MVSDLPVYRRNTTSVTVSIQKRANFVAWVWNQERTEKLVNGKQHSVWLVPTGMKGLPQNVLLNFRLEFPKSDLTIHLPSGISEIFCQIVGTPVHIKIQRARRACLNFFHVLSCARVFFLLNFICRNYFLVIVQPPPQKLNGPFLKSEYIYKNIYHRLSLIVLVDVVRHNCKNPDFLKDF